MTTPTEKSAEEILAESEGKFDIDKALNTKGFAEFLAKHDDAESLNMNNGSELGRRFETFQIKEEVKKELKELYANQIQSEMGIKLEAGDLSSIDAHIEKQAIENPVEMILLNTKLTLFDVFPKQIAGLETELANLGGVESLTANLEALKKDAATLETAKDNMGFVGKTKLAYEATSLCLKAIPTVALGVTQFAFSSDAKLEPTDEYLEGVSEAAGNLDKKFDALRAVKEKHGKIGKKEAGSLLEDMKNNISAIEEKLASIQKVEEVRKLSQETFNKLRKEVLGGISGIDELTKAIQGKVAKQFQEMIRTGTLKSLDDVQARFDSLKNVAQTTETGVNPLEGIDEDKVQEKINAALEKKASEEIIKAVKSTNVGNNALTNLEKVLDPFLKKEKIGSKEGEEARAFIKSALEEASQNLGNRNEDKAKKLMIARIIIKMNS